MKKIFTLCLVAVAAMFAGNAFAQDDTEVTVLVGSTDNLAEIPVTVYLTNPTVDITAVEANLEAPVNVSKFVYERRQRILHLHDQPRQQGLQGEGGCCR